MRNILFCVTAFLAISFAAFAQPYGPGSTPTPCTAFGTATGTCLQGAGALGTPSSGTATNLTGTAAGLTAGAVTGSGIPYGTSANTAAQGNDSRFSVPTITGGTINGATIGATTPSTGAFSSVRVNTALTAYALEIGGAPGVTGFRGQDQTSSGVSVFGTVIGGIAIVGSPDVSASSSLWSGGSASLNANASHNVSTVGNLTIGTISSTTGLFVCETSGLISSGVTTCVASDRRVKDDHGIVSPSAAVARIMALPDEHLFSYKYGYGPSGIHAGWFAQDIKKVWPSVVYRGTPNKFAPDGQLSFDRGEIGPDTTTAVKWLVVANRTQNLYLIFLFFLNGITLFIIWKKK